MEEGVTVVTGASRGIGRAIADALAARGQEVIGVARSAPDRDFPGTFVRADLSDAAATREAMAEIAARHAVLRLVNNAGIYRGAPVESASLEDLEEMVAVNLAAMLLCTQAFLPAMRKARFGRIVNLGSRAALGKAGRLLYGTTKAGVVGFTRNTALEVAAEGITVNCVAPGPIDTEMLGAGQPPGSQARARLEAAIPVGRLGAPEEVAAACCYFLSREAAFTTGQVLYVCGGLSVSAAPI